MLSVSAGMEVGSGGHGGHGGLGGGLVEASPNAGGGGVVGGHGSDGMQEAIVAAARDRAIRAGSVRQDLALDLPPRLQLPDGEERPYGAHTTLHLRDPEQVIFIQHFFPHFSLRPVRHFVSRHLRHKLDFKMPQKCWACSLLAFQITFFPEHRKVNILLRK